MGLAPLTTPAQHTPNGKRRVKSPQASLCASLPPQSPTRITPLKGVVSPPGTPVEEPSPRTRSSGIFPRKSAELTMAVVEDVAREDVPEMPIPPTPALYFQGGVVSQPSVAPEMVSLGLALQQQARTLSRRSSGAKEDSVTRMPKTKKLPRQGRRFWNGHLMLGLGSLVVAGGMALVIHSNSERINALQKKE